jgi:hypothetical protein
MSEEIESYLTKPNPSVEDWIAYNKPFFDSANLRTSNENESLSWAILADFDLHAIQHGSPQNEYFDELTRRVGSLGKFALKLIDAGDDSTAVVIGLDGIADYPVVLRSAVIEVYFRSP